MRLRTRHSDPLVFEVASPTFGPLVTSLGESVEKNTAQEEELGRIKKAMSISNRIVKRATVSVSCD